jgi:hypothetical protein
MNASGNRSSGFRKRALRRLAHEEPAAYAAIYETVRPGEIDRANARGKTWTLLRYQFPDRYFELYAEEQAAPANGVPADIRSKSWARATANLADLRAGSYRKLYDRFSADGMPEARAYDRAMSLLRETESALFTELLTHEYRLWLTVSAAETRRG